MAPRTGCTALGQVLIKEMQGEFIPSADVIGADGFFVAQKKHTSVPELIRLKLISKDQLDRLTVFTTVRNPFDSLVSLYHKLNSGYQEKIDDIDSWVYKVPGYIEALNYCKSSSFEDWINHTYPDLPAYYSLRLRKHFKIITRRTIVPESKFLNSVDYVLRFESLQKDFDRLMVKSGITSPPVIPTINKTSERGSRNYRKYYSDVTKKKVEYYHENTLIKFKYRF